MAKTIYFISGLGADKKAFKKLTFPANYELIYLDWITPMLNETLESYANRLSERIDTASPFYLTGLSFGGMLVTEIAKKLNPEHTFVISSNVLSNQLPWYYRLAGSLKLQQVISLNITRRPSLLMYNLFGMKTQEERALLKQFIIDADPAFLEWAITCILKWNNTVRPPHLTHIHGTTDKILPIKYTQPDNIINDAGHLMVYTHADAVSKLINGIIE